MSLQKIIPKSLKPLPSSLPLSLFLSINKTFLSITLLPLFSLTFPSRSFISFLSFSLQFSLSFSLQFSLSPLLDSLSLLSSILSLSLSAHFLSSSAARRRKAIYHLCNLSKTGKYYKLAVGSHSDNRLVSSFKMMRTSFAKIYEAIVLQKLPSYYQFNKNLISNRIVQDTDDHTYNSNHFDSSVHESNSSSATYNSWMMEHPSALSSFDMMMKEAEGKIIVVFLDYDGTLSPIVDDPDRAFMSEEMRSAVREVATCFPTAIISGRGRDKVKEFVQLGNVYYAGSHGMDIMAPPPKQAKSCNGKHPTKVVKEVLFQPANKFLPTIQKILKVLEEETSRVQGARIEDNRFCISVHFRQVQSEDYAGLEETVKSVIHNYPGFHLTMGKKVFEIRPSIEWNKGDALEYLLDTLGFNSSKNVLPLYIGDDRTDEDAFKVIQSRGQGFPIIVSSTPKETEASYSLRDPSEVLSFLLRLVKWKKNSLP